MRRGRSESESSSSSENSFIEDISARGLGARMIGSFYVKDAREPAPIVGVDVQVEVIDYCSRIEQKQLYRNDEESPLEVAYDFMLPEGTSVSSCSMEIGDRTMKMLIREKESAMNEYDDAIAAGRSVGMVTKKEDSDRCFSVSLGNIAPGEEVLISLTYEILAELVDDKIVISLDGSDCDNIRYAPPSTKKSEKETRVAPGFNFRVHVATRSPLRSVSSPSHPIAVELEDGGKGATVRLADGANWKDNKKFVLEASVADPHVPTVWVQQHTDGSYMAMASFYPTIDTPETKCEMIFVLDRSGSMSGSAIECAKATLQFFLRSLPDEALFNIVSFGTVHTFFKPKSVPYNNDTLLEASKCVERMRADLGGTNIYDPLKKVFSLPTIPGYPRQVFILTDGEVEDSDKCVTLVGSNSSTSRLFAFGIGNSVDRQLVEDMARAGGGGCCIVQNNSGIRAAVMKQLESALQPGLTDVHISWNNKETGKPETGVIQTPANPPPIFRGTRFVSFAVLPSSCSPCQVSLTGSFGDSAYRSEVYVDPSSDKIPGDQIIKLGACSLIRDIEQGKSEGDKLHLSKTYRVLCKKTAFLVVGSSGGPIKASMISRRVPSLPNAFFTSFGSAPFEDEDEDDGLEDDDDIDDGFCCGDGNEDEDEEYEGYICPGVYVDDVYGDVDVEECAMVKPVETKKKEGRVSLDSIVQCLNADGSFRVGDLSLCGLQPDIVLKAVPEAVGVSCELSLLNTLWATIIVVEFIRKRFAKEETEWKLIIAKCEKYVRKHLGDKTFDNWKNSAKAFVDSQ